LPGFASSTEIGAICTFNPQTDGLIPIVITMKNTTAGFTQTLNASTTLPIGDADTINAAVNYAAGPNCESMTNDAAIDTADWSVGCDDLAPDTSCTTYGYIILSNYYTPSDPNGDPSVFAAAILGTNGETYTLNGAPVPQGDTST
jgi:hypothetical protein